MTTFAELSPYVYGVGDDGWLNVGWLGAATQFRTGSVDAALLAKLARLMKDERNVMRGWHDCEFCSAESPIYIRFDEDGQPFETTEIIPRWDLALGHGEVHVPGPDRVIFVAPTLVLHFILSHRYLPPDEFLAALALAPEPGEDMPKVDPREL